MAKRGSGSPGWERRNARARALGYSSYYDYRAHDYGRRSPSEARLRGPELARVRGHRGSADLNRRLERGDVELMNVIQTASDPPEFEVLVTSSDGSTSTYTVRGRKKIDELNRMIDQLGPQGPQIVGSPAARRGMRGLESPSTEEEERAAQEAAELEALAAELGVDPEELGDTLAEGDLLEDRDDDIPF